MRRHFSEALNIEISFFHWMVWAVPIVLVLLASAFVLFAYVLFPCFRLALPRAEDVFRLEKDKLGPMRPVHWRMLGVFLVTALLWMSRGFIQPLLPNLPLTGKPIPLSDEAIAITAAIALFVIPGGTKGKKLLEWEATRKLPWGILLLFGGGIALAKALEQTGLLESLSTMVQQAAGDRPVLLIVLLTLLCLYLTEVMSNIALVQVMIPIVTSIAVGMKADPILFAFPATLAASCAFMLPMATPPNGIVFGSGKLNVWDMMKAGFWMNLVSLVVILLLSFWLVRWFPQN
jgi:sodium-dependent dicarboxylate transporter 2/3/5